MSWTGKKIKDTFKDLLKINSASDNAGVDTSLREVQDGDGGPTGLKLSETAVDASILTSANATITSLSSSGVNIDGGSIDGTSIGLSVPSGVVSSNLGIAGSPKDNSQFSIYTTEAHSNTAHRAHAFNDKKVYHDVNGYFCANIDNKANWTALELVAADEDAKGSAWWELELWVDENTFDAVVGASGTGDGYTSVPLVRAVPKGARNSFPENNGAWAANTCIQGKASAVHWTEGSSIGYIWGSNSSSIPRYTGTISPIGIPSNPTLYNTTQVVENAGTTNEITWTYIGQTANITANMGPGGGGIASDKVASYTINNDTINGTTGWLQGFTYTGNSGNPTYFNDEHFWDPVSHADGSKPVTLEKGASGGTAASGSGVTYNIGTTDGTTISGPGVYLILTSAGDGTIAEGESWVLVQRDGAGGTALRYITMTTTIIGGRGGTTGIVVDEPPLESSPRATAQGSPTHVYRVSRGPRGLGSVLTQNPTGELGSDYLSVTGERTYFAKHKGFVMSRAAYDRSLGSTSSDAIREWWVEDRQKEFKKGHILEDIPYGNTNLGHMHNFDPTYITPDADANVHAKNKFDQAAGKIYNLTGSSDADWAIAESTTQAVFFRTGDAGSTTSELSNTNETYGGASDYEFNKTIYDAAFSGAGGGDAGTIAAKLATISFPNFGNADSVGNAAPGGHRQLNIVLESALDLMTIQSTQNGNLNMQFPEGTNLGSFFIAFTSSNSSAHSIGVGYRLKCWTTPGYIVDLRRVTVDFKGTS